MYVVGWRAIFVTFLLIALIACIWFVLRQPETLTRDRRTPFTLRQALAGVREIVSSRIALGYTAATGLVFAPFVAYLNSSQQIFQDVYGVGPKFPLYFGGLALAIGFSSLVNARLVMRLGMQRLSSAAALALTAVSGGLWILSGLSEGVPPFTVFMAGFLAAFFCIGLLFGNLNALAMQPLGHIAGIGASVVGALSTVISVPIGSLIAHRFDGTVLPVVGGFALFGGACWATIMWANRAES